MRGSDAVTVGIDIGTTSVKAIAVDGSGSVVARARIPHERCVPRPGRYEHDADAAWRVGPARALDALGSVGASAVSVTAMVPSLTAVDAAGTPVSPGLLYGDERGESAPGEMLSGEAVGFLRWTVRASPDAAGVWPAQAVANHALCGEAAISDVAAISLWPLSNGETWDGDVVRRVGGRVEALPRIVPTGKPIGRHDGMVVDAGSIDAVCEQLVAGADDAGDVLVICGASLVVWITAAVRREVPGLWTMARGRDGLTTIGGVSNAGGIFLDWVDALAGGRAPEEDRPLDPSRIPVWAPYPRGERTPLHDPLRRARLADLDLTHDTSALQRAAYEASAFVVRRHVEMSGVTARRIVATGGGTRRAEWMQALADCTGLRVDASAVAESAALGAAFLARVAAGLESDMTAARNWARTGERYSPRDEWCDAADARYRRVPRAQPADRTDLFGRTIRVTGTGEGDDVNGRPRRSWAVALVAALTAVGSVAVAVPAGAQSGDTPGVTKKEIQLGAVIGKTNPTGVDYDQVIKGAEAYLDQVNDDGGVFGRKLKVVKVLDDQTRASKSLLAARSLVEETKVFAVLHASQVFAGSDVFVEAGTPVFGYNIQSEWSAGPSLFGTYGSYLCFECPQLPPAIAAHEGGAKRPAIFAYGSSPSSTDCAESTRDAFERWGPDVAVYDTSLSFGFSANDISGAVQAIKDRQVDFVTTCMDLQGIINLKKALEASGVQGTQFYAPQGYDLENLEQLGDSLDGFTFLAQFTPFEAPQGNPGMKRFLKAMKARNYKPSENYLVGWVGAMLLVRGIEDAGEDFTQDSVVEAINEITDWTADGIVPPVNWQTAHGPAAPGERDCLAFVQIGDEEFTPVFGKPRQPFVCYPINPYPPDLDSPAYYGAGDSET